MTPTPSREELRRGRTLLLFQCLVLSLLVAAVYGRAGSFSFVDFDDGGTVAGNRHVLSGLSAEGVRWAFTTFHTAAWLPFTWLSHMAVASLFGGDPGAHHLANVLLHLANTLLLFAVLRSTTGAPWRSAFAAALFAVHPLHVESVAWVTARKDVLSTFFLFLALREYGGYARRPSPRRYGAVALAFAASLLSKPMGVTFPFLLLLLDAWPLGRSTLLPPADGSPGKPLPARALLVEKVPFLLLSAASVAVTRLAVTRGDASPLSVGALPLAARAANALSSYAAYLGKTIAPVSLAAYYPFPAGAPPSLFSATTAAAAALLAAVTATVFWQRRARPYLPVGWLWYLGTLLPVIGLLQVEGGAAMADRYTYVPLAGIFLAFSWGAFDAVERAESRPLRLAAGAAALLLLLALAAAARVQAGYWKDSSTLFGHALEATGRNHVARYVLGSELYREGRFAEAAESFRRAVDEAPPGDREEAYNGLGLSLARLGRHGEAEEAFREGIALSPRHALLWCNLAGLRNSLGRYEGGYEAAREAVRLDPGLAEGWYQAGNAAMGLGLPAEARRAFREVVRLDPGNRDGWIDLGRAAEAAGDREGVLAAREGAARSGGRGGDGAEPLRR
jgi:tetratricopeptide (TPR) repeat protein